MTDTAKTWQLKFPAAAAVWFGVVGIGVFLGWKMGYGGLRFAVALGVCAALFGFEFFLTAPTVLANVRAKLGQHAAILSPLLPLFAVLIYSFAVSRNWMWILAGPAYAIVPALLLAGASGKRPGLFPDYAAALLIWLPVEFRWMYRIFSYPPPLTHVLTIVFALSTGVAAFVVVRQLDGVGYAIEWRRGFGWQVAFNVVAFGLIAIPLGMKIGFLIYSPGLERVHSLPLSALGILLFTAWPEEFLFRGILQNLFSRTLKNQWLGLILASVIFGLSHILHAPFPNWKYVLLATIAGVFYGNAWMKTGSLLPGAIVHGLVDISWHLLFR